MCKTTQRIMVILFTFLITIAASQIAHCESLQITVMTDKNSYGSDANILVTGNLTLNDSPVSDGLVTLQVDDPEGNLTVIRTLPTGPDVTGPWPLEILEVIPVDASGEPWYSFHVGTSVGLKITVKNGLIKRNVTITVNAYYRDDKPFAAKEFTTQLMYPNQTISWTYTNFIGPIAANAPSGTATVYVNAFSEWPKKGGFAYCPEKSATFEVTGGVTSSAALSSSFTFNLDSTPGTFNLSFRIMPGYGKFGNYTVYAFSFYPPATAKNSTKFELTLIGDITGPEGVPDGKVDIRDVSLVARLFGVREGDPDYDPRADITGQTYLVPDGKIDIRDISLVAMHFGEHL